MIPTRSPRARRLMRAKSYAAGAVGVLVVAWTLGSLTAADSDSDGAVLSGFLAALWSFATYVALVNVVELGLFMRTIEERRAVRRER